MSRFGRAISHLKSTQIDEKIKFLNKELEKTGVVCEAAPANSTANLYYSSQEVAATPEETSPVPDSNGWNEGGTQDDNGGDTSNPTTWDTGWNNVDDMLNGDDVGGEVDRPIPLTPDLSGWNGGYVSANASVIFGGSRPEGQTQPTSATGIAVYSGDQGQSCIGSLGAGNKFVQILVGDAVFGGYAYPGLPKAGGYYKSYTDDEFGAARNLAAAYEANKNGGAVIRKAWVPFETANNGVSYAAYTGAKKTTTVYTAGYPDGAPVYWALKDVNILAASNTYVSRPAVGAYDVITRDSLDDGEFYPGNLGRFMDFLRGALDVGQKALEWLFQNQIDQVEDYFTGSEDSAFKEVKDLIADWNPFTTNPDFEWATELAVSAVMDTPVVRTENDISQSDLDKLYNQVPIENVIIGPIDMIVADGNVFYNPETNRIESNHIDPTLPDGDQPGQRQHADNLIHPDLSTDIGKNEYGYVNPLASEGQGTVIFDPETGQSRLVNFTYYNIDTTDKATEDPLGLGDMFINLMSAIGIDVSGNNPHTGGMAGIPQNLLGMKFTNAVSNNSNLPAQYVNLMNAQAGLLNQNYEPQGELIKEGWESPKHTYIDKNQQKRWFKEKDVAPIYPKKAPPKLVRGYHPDMLPKLDTPIPQIKVKAKDLIRSYKLKKVEAQAWIYKIERLNDYIARNPDMLAYARERYPKSDPHLAALNYKMDMQLAAADEYIEKQFPENIRLYNRLMSATKRSIKLTDPKTFKSEKGVFTTFNKLARVQHVDNVYQPKERTLKLKKRGKNSVNRFLSKPKEKTKDDILKDKLAVLDKEMKKTMPDT